MDAVAAANLVTAPDDLGVPDDYFDGIEELYEDRIQNGDPKYATRYNVSPIS